MVNWKLVMAELLLLAQMISTLCMTGLIWFVQVVHYPLLQRVGVPGFHEYQDGHQKRTTMVVALPMIVELSATAMIAVQPPAGVSPALAWLGAGLLAVIWTSTVLWQIPLHAALEQGYDASVVRQLVATNWVRTAAWTVRAVVVVLMARQFWSGT